MTTTKAIKFSAIIAACASLLGCASMEDKDKRCATYADAYALYQASLEVRQPSKEEVDAAAAAAVFLRVYCGWTAARGNDANGVPVIVPPAK